MSRSDRPCSCGCRDGGAPGEPVTSTPPGQDAVTFRIGTHGLFLERMTARLCRQDFPALAALGTRDPGDFTLGLLDAWASALDVLTFYQERTAQEGYLRTATERRSVLELARLVGYSPRPGVAASLHLAYTLDADRQVTIPRGSRSQSVPNPGQLPQTFETSDDLKADAALNALRPRLSRPQYISTATLTTHFHLFNPREAAQNPASEATDIFLKGAGLNVKTGDVLLAQFKDGTTPDPTALLQVSSATPDVVRGVTVLSAGILSHSFALPPLPPAPETPLRALIRQYAKYASFGIPGTNRTADAIVEQLKALAEGASDWKRVFALVGEERTGARQRGAGRLADWLQGIQDGLNAVLQPPSGAADTSGQGEGSTELVRLTASLLRLPSRPPASPQALKRNLTQLYGEKSDVLPALHGVLFPGIRQEIYQAYSQAPAPTPSPLTRLDVIRVKANLFGYNAPPIITLEHTLSDLAGGGRKDVTTTVPEPLNLGRAWGDLAVSEANPVLPGDVIALDREYEDIKPGSWVVMVRPVKPGTRESVTKYFRVERVETQTMSAPTYTGKSTVLHLGSNVKWFDGFEPAEASASRLLLTQTRVYAAGERLTLADEPMTTDVGSFAGSEDELELDGLYTGLESGRWAILSGERTDLPNTSGVPGTELLMIASVEHRLEQVTDDGKVFLDRPGDTRHTYVRFAQPPRYRYRRETVTLNANVVKATHGETKPEVLGSGDGTQAFQTFILKQPPLTYTAAPTAAGADSTLEVQVGGVVWHEAPTFVEQAPESRVYTVRTDDDGRTSVVFGNGAQGARLPSGQESVRATYRSGIGRFGNVDARQVSLLMTRPLGVKDVINPLPAGGGADREGRDQARKNAPRAVLALDRLVSVQDYADFAQTFAGIGKASAAELTDGRRTVVHVTVAGAQDALIDANGDLYRNLKTALETLGDPYTPLQLDPYARKLLVVQAGVHVGKDYRWVNVEPQIRQALLDAFNFEARELGQGVFASQVIATIQAVPGVEYADLNVLGALGWDDLKTTPALDLLGRADSVRVPLARQGRTGGVILPAELASLTPDVPDTLLLQEIP